MSFPRKIILVLGLLLLLTLVLFTLLTASYFYLPHYLESKIIPQLIAETGIAEFALKVRNIGIFGADLGTLRIGPQQNPALVIRSVQIDYSPKELYQQKIERMTLSGIELYGEFRSGKFFLRGNDLDKVLAKQRSHRKSAVTSQDSLPPVILNELQIRNSIVILKIDDRQYRVPFEITAVPEDSDYNLINVAASLYPRGQKISAQAKFDLKRQYTIINLAASTLDLAGFSNLAQTDSAITLSGKADMKATAHLQLAPFHISSIEASTKLQKCKIRYKDFQLQNVRSSDNEERPITIDLSKISDNEWKINGSAVSITSPMPFVLSDWHTGIKINDSRVESAGKFNVVLQPSSVGKSKFLPVEVMKPLLFPGSYTAKYSFDESLKLRITSSSLKKSKDNSGRFRFNQYEITTGAPAFDISVNGKLKNISAAYSISVPRVLIASPTNTIRLPQLAVKGTADFNNQTGSFLDARFKLQSPQTRMTLASAKIKIAHVSMSGRVKRNLKSTVGFDGLLRFAGAGLTVAKTGVKINGVRGSIPLKWPPAKQKKKGNVSIAVLQYKKLNLGKIDCEIQQTATGFRFKGRHINRLISQMSLEFSGDSVLFDTKESKTNIHLDIQRPIGAADIDIGNFLPGFKGIQVNGKFIITGDLVAASTGFTGSLHLEVHKASLRIPKSDFTVEGIQLSFTLPELPKLRSAPGQYLVFSEIAFGDMTAKNGRIDFQIESPTSFLIEKTHFKWCDGNVDTQSIRISPGKDEYHIIFYCDRLRLSKVLEQFGAAAAKGEGTVNGRIPLQYTNGKIGFNDGFLFSTPGKGGKIYLSGTEILTAGITPNTPQYIQMELAREALKDYDYSWVRLNINSEGEELLLQMQMDGKPAKTLPFVYSKAVGGFIKVDANSKGSKFQGIRLDVNFRLPLNKMLQYKDLIQMIE